MTVPTPPWPAGHTPYVTPDMLPLWPSGVQWGTLPPKTGSTPPTTAQLYQVQSMICLAATAEAKQIANQALHCTQETEILSGPDSRLTVQWQSGNGRFITARWPVTQVTSMSVAFNSVWPRQWTALPAGTFEPELPVDGLYGASAPSANAGGQAILFEPGQIWWPYLHLGGRNMFRVSATFFAGYPHTSITTAVESGASQIAVDDCSGWVLTGTNNSTIGAAGIIYDAMGGGMEGFQVVSTSAQTGPGTLTLSSPLAYDHGTLIVVSAMPTTLLEAAAWLAAHAALKRGATATTVPSVSGRGTTGGMHPFKEHACHLINTFKRTF